jgi:hypothetical protein
LPVLENINHRFIIAQNPLHVKSSGIVGSHGNKSFQQTLPVLVVDFGKGDFTLPSEKVSTDDFGEPE